MIGELGQIGKPVGHALLDVECQQDKCCKKSDKSAHEPRRLPPFGQYLYSKCGAGFIENPIIADRLGAKHICARSDPAVDRGSAVCIRGVPDPVMTVQHVGITCAVGIGIVERGK